MKTSNEINRVLDVKLFFYEVTDGYLELTKSVNDFSEKLSNYSPNKILLECDKIRSKRAELSLLDEQLIEIVKLACSEIQEEPFVDDYRTAFNKAIKAFDELHTNLLLTKAELLSTFPSLQPN